MAKKKKKKKTTFKEVMKSKWGAYIVMTLLGIAAICFFPGNNVFTWIAAREEIAAQQRQAKRYQKEILDMERQIEELTSDKDTLEKFARENFHFAAPEEDIYIIK